MNIKKIIAGAGATALLLSNVAMPAFAAPNWELNAPRNIDFTCGGLYSHSLETVNQNPDGTFTGTGKYIADNSYTWNITGDIENDAITFQLVYTGANAGYTLNGNGTIAGDGSITGTTDGNCTAFSMPADAADEIETTPTPTPGPTIPEECDETLTYNVIEGTSGSDVLNGTSGPDLIYAMGGSDMVNGKGGDDCIMGEGGSDLLIAGAGNDVVLGGDESDSIMGDLGADKLYGGPGSDALNGGDGNDQVWGNAGSDSLKGGNGTDTLDGGDGSDAANGNAGTDTCTAEAESSCEV